MPPVRVASIGNLALKVLQVRVLSMLFGDSGGSRQEATEFDAGSAPRTDAATPPTVEEPTLSSLPTVELPQIDLPTVEVPRIETVTIALEPELVARRHRRRRRRNRTGRRCSSGRS